MEQVTFADIKKANECIRTTDIKGKDYAEVNQRIKAFRMLYPSGFILTDMKSNENGVCVFKAVCGYYDKDGEKRYLGEGTAYEKESSSYINKTSYIENCETSAVGRALGMCGFGIDVSVASAEEVQNAILNQEQQTPAAKQTAKATEKQVEMLKKYYTGDLLPKLLQANNITKIEDISMKKASELIKKWGEKNNG